MPTLSDMSVRMAELRKDMARTADELGELANRDDAGAIQRRANVMRHAAKLEAEFGALRAEMGAEARDGVRSGRYTTESGYDAGDEVDDPGVQRPGARGTFPLGGGSANTRGDALRAIERADVPDVAKERFTVEVERATGEHGDRLAKWATATADEHYLRAFLKLIADPEHGHREFSDTELHAFRNVRNLSRAMSLTDAAGGYLVPFQLDPTVILTSSGGTNPVRQIARKVVATGDVWNGVSSAGITASWDAEATEVSDDAPTFAQPAIPVYKMSAFVPISIEAFEDAANVAQEIAMMLADSADVLEAEALQIGTGVGQPTGIVTALTGTASEVNRTGSTLDADDFRATQEALPSRWQSRASWIANLVSINRGRSIVAGTGLTTPLVSDETSPPRVLGKPIYEASFMDPQPDAIVSDYLLVYGDFQNYVIADRIGTNIEFIPHLFGANRRPTGQRGWWMHRRAGGDSVNDRAFVMLDKSS